ncbi:MAG TPA: PP0621 family protein [Gallionellaceae bacterium]
MGRLLFILAIVAVIIWWLKSMRNQQQPPRQDEQQQPPPRAAEDMVRCAQCGVHLPRSESYLVGGKFYCSEAHSRGSSDKPE